MSSPPRRAHAMRSSYSAATTARTTTSSSTTTARRSTELTGYGSTAPLPTARTASLDVASDVLLGLADALLPATEAHTARKKEEFAARDTALAVAVWRKDVEIDELYNSMFRELITYMMEDPRTITLGSHCLFIAKNLERIGDHTTHIAEMAYFIQEGEPLGDDRPKGEPVAPAIVEEGNRGDVRENTGRRRRGGIEPSAELQPRQGRLRRGRLFGR